MDINDISLVKEEIGKHNVLYCHGPKRRRQRMGKLDAQGRILPCATEYFALNGYRQ